MKAQIIEKDGKPEYAVISYVNINYQTPDMLLKKYPNGVRLVLN